MPEKTITVELTQEEIEVVTLPEGHGRDDWDYHHLRGNAHRKLRAALATPTQQDQPPASQINLPVCTDCKKVRFDRTGHCTHCGQREAESVQFVPANEHPQVGLSQEQRSLLEDAAIRCERVAEQLPSTFGGADARNEAEAIRAALATLGDQEGTE